MLLTPRPDTDENQITEYGGASDILAPSKEDERSSALALRARQGDYDDGATPLRNRVVLLLMASRLNSGTTGSKSRIPEGKGACKVT